MADWPVQDAKARFSEVLRDAEKEPQRITHRGVEKAVVLSAKEYRRLTKRPAERTAFDWWNKAPKVPDFELPPRRGRMRPVKL